jgi:hypothetical protein
MKAFELIWKTMFVLMMVWVFGYLFFMSLWSISGALHITNGISEKSCIPGKAWCSYPEFGVKDWMMAITFMFGFMIPWIMILLEKTGNAGFMDEFFEKHATKVMIFFGVFLIILALGLGIAFVHFLSYVGDGL